LSSNPRLISYAREITQGTVKPRIGDFVFYDGINLKISLVVNYENQQIVVAQTSVKGEWAANPQ